MIKGLRPVQEGFAVPMHENAYETWSRIPGAFVRGVWRTVRTSPSALGQQPRQIGLNHDDNMIFSISPRECWYFPLKIQISCSKRQSFRVLLPLLRHVVLLSDGNSLKILVVLVTRYLTPTCVLSAPDGPHVGPTNLAIRDRG